MQNKVIRKNFGGVFKEAPSLCFTELLDDFIFQNQREHFVVIIFKIQHKMAHILAYA